MIKKLLIFSKNNTIRIHRTFYDTLDNEEIIKIILKEKHINIVDLPSTGEQIIYQKYKDIIISMVIGNNENEFFIFALIKHLMQQLNILFLETTELHLIYKFNEIYECIDDIFAGGHVIKLIAK